MLEHRKLIEGVVVRMLALVLDHDMPKPARRTSSQLQVPPGQRTPAVVTRTENVLGNLAAEQVSTSSCFFSVVSVAQQAIVAIHVRQNILSLFWPKAQFVQAKLSFELSSSNYQWFCQKTAYLWQCIGILPKAGLAYSW